MQVGGGIVKRSLGRRLPVGLLGAALLAPWMAGCSEGSRDGGHAAAFQEEDLGAEETLAEGAVEVPAGAPVVAFLGDSIAAGYQLSSSEAFPAALQRELARDGRPFRLVNAGVSGDTSAGGLRRVDWVLRQKPEVLVIELGGNDGLRGQSAVALEDNLRGIVERARAAGAKVLLLGQQLPPSLGLDYVHDFEAVYPRLAAELDVAFVPQFMLGVGGVADLNLADGLHPTAEGHRRIAERIAPVLGALLDGLAN
jgi:acyl-CoA thioesterase I